MFEPAWRDRSALATHSSIMRDLERLQYGARFVRGLLIFPPGPRTGHDSGARLYIRPAVFRNQGAQADARIEIAGKIQIQDRTGVNAAARRLKLVDDFHGADLRGTRERSGGKAGHQRVEAINVVTQPAAQAGRDVHHVRIALDEHQPLWLDRAVFADAAQIVAPEIDQHDVLGTLLRIGQQRGFEIAVLFFRPAAWTRSRERTIGGLALLDFDQHFRRAADDGDVVELEEIKIRRGI